MKTIDFKELSREIFKFYPLGLNEFDDEYKKHVGIQLLGKLCSKKHKSPDYAKWDAMFKIINDENDKIVNLEVDTPLFDPCYMLQCKRSLNYIL